MKIRKIPDFLSVSLWKNTL